jgi:hypothetical protein
MTNETTFNAINALKELLAAGAKYREAEYAVRTSSSTKARKAVIARNEALERLHRAESIARDAIDANL